MAKKDEKAEGEKSKGSEQLLCTRDVLDAGKVIYAAGQRYERNKDTERWLRRGSMTEPK